MGDKLMFMDTVIDNKIIVERTIDLVQFVIFHWAENCGKLTNETKKIRREIQNKLQHDFKIPQIGEIISQMTAKYCMHQSYTNFIRKIKH